MTRKATIILTFVSTVLFPWPLTACLALALAPFEPLIPLAVGIVMDTLYYSHTAASFPHATLYGTLASAVAFFVRNRLKARIM